MSKIPCHFEFLRKDFIPSFFWFWLLLAILGWIWGDKTSPEVAALIFTAVFVAWYSIETAKLVAEMNITNAIEVKPLLILAYEIQHGWKVTLKNIGRGPALTIKLDTVDKSFRLVCHKSILAADEEVDVRIEKFNTSEQEWKLANFSEDFNKIPLEIKMTYKNAESSNTLDGTAKIYNPPRIDMDI